MLARHLIRKNLYVLALRLYLKCVWWLSFPTCMMKAISFAVLSSSAKVFSRQTSFNWRRLLNAKSFLPLVARLITGKNAINVWSSIQPTSQRVRRSLVEVVAYNTMLQSSCSQSQSLNSFIHFGSGALQLGDSVLMEASSHFLIAAASVFFFCSL